MRREGVGLARSLRRRMTPWEKTIWKKLRSDPQGFHFRRQHPFGPYILDFFCHTASLCVEIDSEAHEIYSAQKDSERDAYLEAHGIAVLRIKNAEVVENPSGCARRILRLCLERCPREEES